MAAEPMEVVMEVKGAAVTVAANEEAAVAEEMWCRICRQLDVGNLRCEGKGLVVGFGLLSLGCFVVGVLRARRQGKGNAGAAWKRVWV